MRFVLRFCAQIAHLKLAGVVDVGFARKYMRAQFYNASLGGYDDWSRSSLLVVARYMIPLITLLPASQTSTHPRSATPQTQVLPTHSHFSHNLLRPALFRSFPDRRRQVHSDRATLFLKPSNAVNLHTSSRLVLKGASPAVELILPAGTYQVAYARVLDFLTLA